MDVLLEQPPWILGVATAVSAIALYFLFQSLSQQRKQLDNSTRSRSINSNFESTQPPPQTTTGGGTKKKKKGKSKKKASNNEQPIRVVEKEPEAAAPVKKEKAVKKEPATVVKEEEVENTPPPAQPAEAAADTATTGGKKKKKKKAKAAAPAPPAPPKSTKPVNEKEISEKDSDDDDDDDDVAVLLNANQLSKATTAQKKKDKKKKKKKKKGASDDSADDDDDDDEKRNEYSNGKGVEEKWVVVNKQHNKDEQQPTTTTDVSDEEKVHTVMLTIEAADKPIILGPKGTTIQNIQNESNTKLDIDLPVLKITGTDATIAIAKDMVQTLLRDHYAKTAYTKTLQGSDINSSEGIKAIIGKGGTTIQNIQSSTGCKLDANIDGGQVIITGPSQEQVDRAATLCRHAVFGEHQVTIDLQDKSKVMLVLGTNFTKIKQFQDESGGAKLDIAKNSTILHISGPTTAVNKARDMVNAWLNQCAGITLNIPPSTSGSFDKVGAIYGKGGATIRTIQDKTGAFINVDDKKSIVQISGVPTAVQGALKLVQQAMEDGCLIEDGEIKDIITMPKKAGPTVIGRGGSNIKQLEKTHQVKVRLSGQTTCILIGKPNNVNKCKDEIQTILQPFIEEEQIQREAERLAAEQTAAVNAGNVEDAGAWTGATLNDDDAEGW